MSRQTVTVLYEEGFLVDMPKIMCLVMTKQMPPSERVPWNNGPIDYVINVNYQGFLISYNGNPSHSQKRAC